MILDVLTKYRETNPYGKNCRVKIKINEKSTTVKIDLFDQEIHENQLGTIRIKETGENIQIVFSPAQTLESVNSLEELKRTYSELGKTIKAFQDFEAFFKVEKNR